MKTKSIYMIGIGGIGMSALARYYIFQGNKVYGYDAKTTSITRALEADGAQIVYSDDVSNVVEDVDLVIYTPAIKDNNQLLRWYRDHGYTVMKRSEALEQITKDYKTYAVAGTHGKTTTSAMLAHVLNQVHGGVNAFIGGISNNYNSNFLQSPNDELVIEADEFDRSFLKLNPNYIILTSLDADHLDIYGTHEEMINSYHQFVDRIASDGVLVTKYELNFKYDGTAKHCTYSLQNDYADAYAKNIMMKNGGYVFDVHTPVGNIEGIELHMGGMYNIENAVAVICLCMELEMDPESIKQAIASFLGVRRRFEYVYRDEKHVYIDDYAHHPEELRGLISSARSLFQGRPVNIIFQPHLFSRTQDLASEFASALDTADNIILMEIYPARELPIAGVNSELLISLMQNENKHIMSPDAILQWVRATNPTLLITAGAGDIDLLVEPIKKIYDELDAN